ncbi:DUF3800 domain-containing protein [Candidatus Spongiisocius sp.]|uniref:DUF3800 domain-containing protein n=1 Tax=Candidatus Spongiisocius sp. TaxID=3101273 RepID=UPI003B5B43C3
MTPQQSTTVRNLYFDESGFTGANLADPEQPWFVYVGVALDEEEACLIHTEAYSRFRLQGSELKGANLIKTTRGRRALSWILGVVCEHARAVVADKRYALAGKFFDYMIEPILAERNATFYEIDFHKFVATHLFLASKTDKHHDELLMAFSRMMRRMDPGELDEVFSVWRRLEGLSPIGQLHKLSKLHREKIEGELGVARNAGPMANWTLELTATALYSLLCYWGETSDGLEVYCDNSKPLVASAAFFDGFIGRRDKGYVQLSSAPPSSIVFNLNKPVRLVDSRSSYGIQLADVLASTLAYTLKNPVEPISKEWRSLYGKMLVNSIVPDLTLMDLRERTTFINTQVLFELTDGSRDRVDLLKKMPIIVRMAKSMYPYYLHSLDAGLEDFVAP